MGELLSMLLSGYKRGGCATRLDKAVPPVFRSGPPTLLCGGVAFVVAFIILSFFMIDRRSLGLF